MNFKLRSEFENAIPGVPVGGRVAPQAPQVVGDARAETLGEERQQRGANP